MIKYLRTHIVEIIVLLLVYSISIPSFAAKSPKENDLYEIEVLIFTQPESKNIQYPEAWPDYVKFPAFNKSRELLSPYEQLLYKDQLNLRSFFAESMNESDDDLSKQADIISRRKELTLLFHKRWVQSMEENNRTLPVYIADTNQTYLFQPISAENSQTLEADAAQAEVPPEQQLLNQLLAEEKLLNQPVQEHPDFISDTDPIEPFDEMNIQRPAPAEIAKVVGPPQHKLFGLIKLFKGRYPHLAIDLFYRNYEAMDTIVKEKSDQELFPMQSNAGMEKVVEPVEPAVAQKEGILVQEKPPRAAFPLNVSTRIRLDEIHYFDHPLFGVITRVKKYEAPETKQAAKK